MKILGKRSIALLLTSLLVISVLTGCVQANTEDNTTTETPTTTTDTSTTTGDTAQTTETAVVDPLDTSAATTLNLAVFYNNTVYMRYTVDGANNRPQSEYVAANGKTYRDGDFKPVWEELQNRLNLTINDVTPSDAKDVRAAYTSLQAQGFSGVDVMVGNAADIVTDGVTNGTFVALDEYLDIMPNFKSFLDANGIVKTSITSGDGHIYYAPYFDGYNDIERMFIFRADWVQKLLDDDSAEYNTDRKINTVYEPYMPETLNTTVKAVKADGSGVQDINKKYSKNVITAQNELEVKDGANLVKVLKDHIDSTYGGAYKNRSDLFIGQDAAYDADEMVALMRCVLANTGLLTGQTQYAAVPFFPRSHQAGRIVDLIRLAEIWGIRGLESRRDYVYMDTDGTLKDARTDPETMEGLERMNALYKEGLILQDFDKKESTEGLSGADHRERLLKANLGFATYDYNQTTTVFNSLDSEIPGFDFRPVLPPVADWDNNGQYYQFTDSWRSVKSDGWAILSSVKSDDVKLKRALKLFDYQYSAEGNRLMSYGPESWIDGEITYGGKQVPKLSAAALTELSSLAGGNYTNYYRMWLGATFPIGYVKEQGMEYQTVHTKGQIGLDNILRACELGTMRHLVVDSSAAQTPADTMMPTTFAMNKVEELYIKDNCTELANLFRNGNNDTDRIVFTDYIIYGFEGKMPTGETLLNKEGLVDYLFNSLRGSGYIQVYNEAYKRMMTQ